MEPVVEPVAEPVAEPCCKASCCFCCFVLQGLQGHTVRRAGFWANLLPGVQQHTPLPPHNPSCYHVQKHRLAFQGTHNIYAG